MVLNNVQLDYLARDDPSIETLFLWDSGLWPFAKDTRQKNTQRIHCEYRPLRSARSTLVGAVDHQNVCEVMDSYALPLER